jgi:hypothetical protein
MYSSLLAKAYAELGKMDDAWRCMGDAMAAVETTKETFFRGRGPSLHRRNLAQVAGTRSSETGSVFRACARSRATAAGWATR